jgi:TolA-binding protein
MKNPFIKTMAGKRGHDNCFHIPAMKKLIVTFTVCVLALAVHARSAVEEFLCVDFRENTIFFSRAATALHFLHANVYCDTAVLAVFNQLPYRVALPSCAETMTSLPISTLTRQITLEVSDKNRGIHRTSYRIIVRDGKISDWIMLLQRGNEFIPIPKGKAGIDFLFVQADEAGKRHDPDTAVDCLLKILAMNTRSGFPHSIPSTPGNHAGTDLPFVDMTSEDTIKKAMSGLIALYQKRKEYPQLYHFCRRYLRAFPRDEQAGGFCLKTADILRMYGNYKEAVWMYERGIRLTNDSGCWFFLGFCHEQLKDFERAAHCYEQYLLKNVSTENTPVAVFRLATVYVMLADFLSGKIVLEEPADVFAANVLDGIGGDESSDSKGGVDTSQATKSLEEVNPSEQKKPELTPEQKETLQKQFSIQAYHLYTRFVRTYPSHFLCNEALFRTGLLCCDLGRYNEALNYLELLGEKEPDQELCIKALYQQGVCYLGKEEYRKAVELFTAVQRRNRAHALAKESLFRIGLCHYNLKDYMQGYGFFTNFTASCPESVLMPEATYYGLACLFYETVRKYSGQQMQERLKNEMDPILSQLKDLVLKYPAHYLVSWAEALIGKGYEILLPDEMNEGKEGLFVDLSPFVDAVRVKYPSGPDTLLYQEGMKLAQEKKYQEAGGVFLILLQSFPGSALVSDTSYQLGLVYGNLKAYKQGIEMMKTLVKTTPNHQLADDALYLAGYYCLCLERYQGAKKAFELLIKTYPESPRAQWATKDVQMMEEKGLGKETGTQEVLPAQVKSVSSSLESQSQENEHYHKRQR